MALEDDDDKKTKIADHAKTNKPAAKDVTDFHTHADTDGSPKAVHHTLGPNQNQAAAGNHTHDGGQSAKLTNLLEGVTVTGSTGGNVALQNLLSALATNLGLTNSTTP